MRELFYILLRITLQIRHRSLQRRLEDSAFGLLENLMYKEFEKAAQRVAFISELVALGKELYEIDPVHADYLLEELNEINSAIRHSGGYLFLPNELSDVDKLFRNLNNNRPKNESPEAVNSVIRQSAVADKIRSSSNSSCQMKDLLEAFPNVSERTLRNDLQKLIQMGAVQRMGFGPGSVYKSRSSA